MKQKFTLWFGLVLLILSSCSRPASYSFSSHEVTYGNRAENKEMVAPGNEAKANPQPAQQTGALEIAPNALIMVPEGPSRESQALARTMLLSENERKTPGGQKTQLGKSSKKVKQREVDEQPGKTAKISRLGLIFSLSGLAFLFLGFLLPHVMGLFWLLGLLSTIAGIALSSQVLANLKKEMQDIKARRKGRLGLAIGILSLVGYLALLVLLILAGLALGQGFSSGS